MEVKELVVPGLPAAHAAIERDPALRSLSSALSCPSHHGAEGCRFASHPVLGALLLCVGRGQGCRGSPWL